MSNRLWLPQKMRRSAAGRVVPSSYEDFTTYTEVDPNNKLSATSTVITGAGQDRQIASYIYKDFGAAYFGGDFEIHGRFYIDSATDQGGLCHPITVGNDLNVDTTLNDIFHLNANSKNFLSMQVDYNKAITTPRVFLTENYTGFDWGDVAVDTQYYFKFIRDETVGANGTIYFVIYDDEAMTSLVDTLTLALSAKIDFRYLFPAQSFDDNQVSDPGGYFTTSHFNIITP